MDGYGLVLGGGGARGGYEIGVWKALDELKIPVAAVAGTSVGALNGAMFVQGDFEKAYKLWTGITPEMVMRVQGQIANMESRERDAFTNLNRLRYIIEDGGIDVTPLKELLKSMIDEDKIRKSPMDFGIVTFSLTDRKPVKLYKKDIPEGKIADYLLASASFPAFKSQEIEGKRFIDGAVYDNLPVSLIVERNIKDIIVVDVSGIGIVRKVKNRDLRVINIKNSEDLGGVLEFSGQRSEKNIELGYLDALKAFGKCSGTKYFIMTCTDSQISNRVVSSIGIEELKRMYSFLGINMSEKPSVSDRLLIYKLIRVLKQYTGGKLSMSTILPAAAEITAEQIGIDRRRMYTIDELIEKVIAEYNNMSLSSDFNEYIKNVKEFIAKGTQAEFDRDIKDFILEGKFLIYYNPSFNESSDRVKKFRKFIALAFPKICIANIFISLLLSRKNEDNIS